jgi:hypothetical protein
LILITNIRPILLFQILFGSSKDDQIVIIDIDLNRTRKLHKKRFEGFEITCMAC